METVTQSETNLRTELADLRAQLAAAESSADEQRRILNTMVDIAEERADQLERQLAAAEKERDHHRAAADGLKELSCEFAVEKAVLTDKLAAAESRVAEADAKLEKIRSVVVDWGQRGAEASFADGSLRAIGRLLLAAPVVPAPQPMDTSCGEPTCDGSCRAAPQPCEPSGDAGEAETEPRVPGCQCHREVGDSPCRVHGDESADIAPPAPLRPAREVAKDAVSAAWERTVHVQANWDRAVDAVFALIEADRAARPDVAAQVAEASADGLFFFGAANQQLRTLLEEGADWVQSLIQLVPPHRKPMTVEVAADWARRARAALNGEATKP